jgi:hypothetical protein
MDELLKSSTPDLKFNTTDVDLIDDTHIKWPFVLSDLQITASDYPFGILELFRQLLNTPLVS